MANPLIFLEAAPNRFFDKKKWAKYVALFPNQKAAMASVATLSNNILNYYAVEDAKRGGPNSIKAELGLELFEDFLKMLKTGALHATGIMPPQVERVEIPSELWSKLVPHLQENTARSENYNFVSVCVRKVATNHAHEMHDLKCCTQWLIRRRQSHGTEFKKELQKHIQDDLGSSISVRLFDKAYTNVYKRNRGRPPKPPKPSKK